MYQDPILQVVADWLTKAAAQPESRDRGEWFLDSRQMLRGGSVLYYPLLSRPDVGGPLPPALSLSSQCLPIPIASEASLGNQDPRQHRGSSSALSQVDSQSTPVAELCVLVAPVAHPAAGGHLGPFGLIECPAATTACRTRKKQQAEKW